MDLQNYFATLTEVPVRDAQGTLFTFFFRNATTEEELEFRRRAARQTTNLGGGRNKIVIEPTDQSLKAPLYLLEKTLSKIMITNGTGVTEEAPREQWQYIPDVLKEAAWAAFRSQYQTEEKQKLED
jgi:hypothetical protein